VTAERIKGSVSPSHDLVLTTFLPAQ